MKKVVIVGGGFAGLNAAKTLGGKHGVDVTLIDKRNHHLFQPLLYQVAMAGLSPADIAAPIRRLLARYPNIRVLLGEVRNLELQRNTLVADIGETTYDYLLICSGATHSYFNHEEWEEYAPGLKTIEQATEIRRRVLTAFEEAERCGNPEARQRLLTFIIVGGGPTGVELAGAIGEMSRFTLAQDFRSINARSARVILIEAGPRILPMFSEAQAARAERDLGTLGVTVRTRSPVTRIDRSGVEIGNERVLASVVLWAAGVQASPLGRMTAAETDAQGRVLVEPDLTIPSHRNVFVAGDLARFTHQTGKPLPGTAPVAMQQGRYVANMILHDLDSRPRAPFHFADKGQMATIGRSRAIVEIGKFKLGGWLAWILWLTVHIYYLTGFENRVLVVFRWAWSYLTFGRGARLIVGKDWKEE